MKPEIKIMSSSFSSLNDKTVLVGNKTTDELSQYNIKSSFVADGFL